MDFTLCVCVLSQRTVISTRETIFLFFSFFFLHHNDRAPACTSTRALLLQIRQRVQLKDSKDQETFDMQGTPDTRGEEVGYGNRLIATGLLLAARILGMSAAH